MEHMPAPFVAPDAIRRRAFGAGYERGVRYFRSGAVRDIAWDEASRVLTAQVRGSGAHPYSCTIRLDPGRPGAPILLAVCSCPMAADCKHTVAALLASNAALEGASGASATAVGAAGVDIRGSRARADSAPSWRDLIPGTPHDARSVPLALGFDLIQRRTAEHSAWMPRRTEPVTPRSVSRSARELLLRARPLMRSPSTGAWIKGEASWEAVRRPGASFVTAQARWFAELYSIARDVFAIGAFPDSSDAVTIDTVGSVLLWPQLRRADQLGIALVGLNRLSTVTLATEAESTIRIAPAPTGGLRVGAEFVIAGERWDAASVRAIGRSGVYAFAVEGDSIRVTLAELPLSDPVHALVSTGGEIAVAEAETEEFLREGSPRLARRAVVRASGGISIPPAHDPTPVLSVEFRAADTLHYAFAWDYPGLARAPETGAPDPADPDRDRGAEERILRNVEAAWAGGLDSPFQPAGTLQEIATAEFMTRVVPALERQGVRVETRGTRRAYRELTGAPRITVSTVESADADWFDLGVIVAIDGRTIPFAPLFTALTLGKKKLLLSDGRYFSLAHPALHRLRELIDEAAEVAEWETGPRISRHQSSLWSDFEDVADEAVPARSWRAAIEGLRDIDHVAPTPAPSGLRAQLRPYQKSGFDWLAFLWRHRLGGVLADDMGLGKTVQMLALMVHAKESGEHRPFLVVAPTSVTSTWRDEAARFVPGLRVTSVGTTRGKRNSSVGALAAEADVVVTSYALLRLSEDEFGDVEWAAVILDEAQFVKNPQTKLHRAAQALRADATYAITGTPLENSLIDLWSILALAAPGLFASGRRFRQDYVAPIEQGKVPENQEGGAYRAARLERLRRRIRPLVLRRTKEIVAPELPPRQEQQLHIELSPAHRGVYDAVLQRERQKVLGLLDDLDRNRFIVFRSLTLLRLLSLAPELVDPAHAPLGSSKIDALIDQLVEIVAEGHRVLVFSQFTSFLALVARRLHREQIGHTQLDGSTRHRDEVIARFRAGESPVFLISLKAGGFGLTLTEADYVFLLDPWWNPAAEAQAVDRTHRIGQERTVMVYRMIASDTIEEKVMALQQRKARLFTAVMDDEALFGQTLSADDIRSLLEG
jgi:superfamily II DNA or RNA helicase